MELLKNLWARSDEGCQRRPRPREVEHNATDQKYRKTLLWCDRPLMSRNLKSARPVALVIREPLAQRLSQHLQKLSRANLSGMGPRRARPRRNLLHLSMPLKAQQRRV